MIDNAGNYQKLLDENGYSIIQLSSRNGRNGTWYISYVPDSFLSSPGINLPVTLTNQILQKYPSVKIESYRAEV